MRLHFVLFDIVDTLKRRRNNFAIPALCSLVIGGGIAIFWPPTFESYSTILLQDDPSPILPVQRGVVSADPLVQAEEIIQSRVALAVLMDSLGLTWSENSVVSHDLRKEITVNKRGANILRFTASSSNPERAHQMARVVTSFYSETRRQTRAQQLDEAVKFYESKVEEYRQAYESHQQGVLASSQEQARATPRGQSGYRLSLNRVETELGNLDRTLENLQWLRQQLVGYGTTVDSPAAANRLAAISDDSGVPFLGELRTLARRYSELLERYTPKYPEVQSVQRQLSALIGKSVEALDAEIASNSQKRSGLVAQRQRLLENLSTSITLDETSDGRRTESRRYRELYDGMKIQLEQVRTARELHARSGNSIVILDHAQLPTVAVSPNRGLILGISVVLGVVLGILGVVVGEVLDPTIRRHKDLEIFGKPVIASIP